jgi:starch synthase
MLGGHMPQQKPLTIAMFSAEAVPYAKVGGLADVVGALPKALENLGARLTLVLPAYKAIHNDTHDIRPCESVPGLDIEMGAGRVHAEIFRTRIPGTSVDVLFIGCGHYFDRDGIYDDPAAKEGYLDNMERFTFFMKAGIALLGRLGQPFDIIHCHDSQTALIPGLIRTVHGADPFFARTGTLFTIHNLAYQGLYPREALYWAGIDYRHFYHASPFEFWGQVNFMKAGIELSDKINTVSKTYAAEIQSGPEFGCGLEGVLKTRKADLYGIVNGIDYEAWDPETDPWIPAHFSSRDLSGKAACKDDLLKYLGLPRSGKRIPLIGIVSRLADQKGFDLISEAIEEIAVLDLQMVVLGTGQQKYHELFHNIAARYPLKIGLKLGFDNALAHRIEAGCDMFLMPSKYEPCGLNQLYSLRYGTVPIVRATGGLADTVINFDARDGSGTGFSFVPYSAGEMMACIRRALSVYAEPERWKELIVRAMSQDWSWESSAQQYLDLYEELRRSKQLKPTASPR